MATSLRKGDRVRYSAKFLRSMRADKSDDHWHDARGTVTQDEATQCRKGRDVPFTRVQWDGDDRDHEIPAMNITLDTGRR